MKKLDQGVHIYTSRVPKAIRAQFKSLVALEGKTTGEVLAECMLAYIKRQSTKPMRKR
jgi:hypothetical protein